MKKARDEKMEVISGFVEQGTPVIIVESVEDLEELDIYDEVIMVEKE